MTNAARFHFWGQMKIELGRVRSAFTRAVTRQADTPERLLCAAVISQAFLDLTGSAPDQRAAVRDFFERDVDGWADALGIHPDTIREWARKGAAAAR